MTTVNQPEPKAPYTWDYFGESDPAHNPGARSMYNTFSIGVFQWLPKSGGRGVKRGKVVKRFTGLTTDPNPVYEKARALIKELTAQ